MFREFVTAIFYLVIFCVEKLRDKINCAEEFRVVCKNELFSIA
jgi:hypothetical protein